MEHIAALFVAATIQFNLPSGLLSSLCFVESRHNVAAIHHDDGNTDSIGICQVKLATARDFGFEGTAEELLSPKANIDFAAKYLAHQLKRYNGQVVPAVIAYNQGSARGLTRTRYSDKVMSKLKEDKNYDARQCDVKIRSCGN
jgi:soluble lytic murein transglycosylase-like protein